MGKKKVLRPYNLQGQKFAEARIRARLTQAQAAAELGYKTAQSISNIERGRSAPYDTETAEDLLGLPRGSLRKLPRRQRSGKRRKSKTFGCSVQGGAK